MKTRKKKKKPATEAKQAPQQPKAKPNPLAMEWKDNNEWFEKRSNNDSRSLCYKSKSFK